MQGTYDLGRLHTKSGRPRGGRRDENKPVFSNGGDLELRRQVGVYKTVKQALKTLNLTRCPEQIVEPGFGCVEHLPDLESRLFGLRIARHK